MKQHSRQIKRAAVLLALVLIVLAVPASAKFVEDGSVVWSTTLDGMTESELSEQIKGGMWVPDYDITKEVEVGTLSTVTYPNDTRTWTATETGYVFFYAHTANLSNRAELAATVNGIRVWRLYYGETLVPPATAFTAAGRLMGHEMVLVSKGDTIIVTANSGNYNSTGYPPNIFFIPLKWVSLP